MSYDLHVFAPQALSLAELQSLIVASSGLDVEASSADGVTVVRGVRRRYSFTIDGPDRVEDDDVPDEVGRVVLDVRFLYTVLVEGTAASEIPHAVQVRAAACRQA